MISTNSTNSTVRDFDDGAGPLVTLTSNRRSRSAIRSSAADIGEANRSGFVTRPYASAGGSSTAAPSCTD
ncbi:hypothetical protein CJ177_44665 [Rhodococcus sp. ACPA1]|nr:hypothetical protein CJ177_44665 [Rhodococcus sp. ACPA1]